ncbi:MAG: TVP38/TMEM64 family protein [Cyanobacteriota bacterium]|nr:TVP38/TMEM64 family protein [Cyanobacteriota bacterium]
MTPLHPEAWLPELLPWLRSPLGAVAFVPLYALWVTLLLPGVWASMLAGALYGTLWGSVVTFLGASLGALLVFQLARGRMRPWARRQLETTPRLQAIEAAVSREGLRLVVLTRLSPAFPFSLLNLAYGLSAVSLKDYSLGLLAILPGTVLFCSLGALAGDVARFGEVLTGATDPYSWAVRISGIAATVLVSVLVTQVARRALRQQPQEREAAEATTTAESHHTSLTGSPSGQPME